MRLRCPKPKRGYPFNAPFDRRLDLGLHQKAAAARIGIDGTTVGNWENARTEVEVRFYPALIQFLGYNPVPHARTRGSGNSPGPAQSGALPGTPGEPGGG